MTTTFTVTNHGPGVLAIRVIPLNAKGEPTGFPTGRDLPPGEKDTFYCYEHQTVRVDEVI